MKKYDELTDTVFCKKYKEMLPAMQVPPLVGKIGQELMLTVSQKALEAWREHQTMLINERRLDLSVRENRSWLLQEMLKFFDDEEVAQPEGFVPPTTEESSDPVQQFTPPPEGDLP